MTEPVDSADGGAQSREHGFENQRRLRILAAVVWEPSWSRAELEVHVNDTGRLGGFDTIDASPTSRGEREEILLWGDSVPNSS